jgi:predicted DNA-binding transcriptional regulator AlpA
MTDQSNSPEALRLLPPVVVADRTSLSWRTIQRKVRDGDFPKPRRVSQNRIAFVEADVNAWINSQPVAA